MDSSLLEDVFQLTNGALESSIQAIVSKWFLLEKWRLFSHSILGKIGKQECECDFTVSRALDVGECFIRYLSQELASNEMKLLKSSVVAKEQPTSLEGMDIGQMNAHSRRCCSNVSNHARRLCCLTNFSQIFIAPRRFRLFKDGWRSTVTTIPTDTKAIGVNDMVESMSKAWMEGSVHTLIDQRVTWS
jgi:hypothetical protein